MKIYFLFFIFSELPVYFKKIAKTPKSLLKIIQKVIYLSTVYDHVITIVW